MMKIGFVGLGNVGGKLANNLLENNFQISVLDKNHVLMDEFKLKGAKTAKSIKGLVVSSDILITCLPSPKICAEVLESRVMTAISINRVAEPYIKNKASNHLDKNRVVIFASGTGNPFFSTDTAAVLRASEMKSDIILKGTKVDGIYDKDPKENSNAKKISTISYSDYLNKDIKVMDATAISLAKDRSLPIIIFSILKSSNIIDIVNGDGSYSIIKDTK